MQNSKEAALNIHFVAKAASLSASRKPCLACPFTPMAEESPESQPPSAEPLDRPDALPGTAPRPAQPDEAHRPVQVWAARYRRIVSFFVLLVIRIIFWEVVARRVVGERRVARGRTERWRSYARQFRGLAVDMGGVMIQGSGSSSPAGWTCCPRDSRRNWRACRTRFRLSRSDDIKRRLSTNLAPSTRGLRG